MWKAIAISRVGGMDLVSSVTPAVKVVARKSLSDCNTAQVIRNILYRLQRYSKSRGNAVAYGHNTGLFYKRTGFLQLLTQLTSVGDVSEEQYLKRFAAMKACPGTYYVLVLEDLNTSEVIGAATLVVEQKFIHNCGTRGRLEDVVVSDKYRGKQLGKLLTNRVSILAQELRCYKLTLECKDKLIPFYGSLGFTAEKGNSNFMTIRFNDVS